MLNQIYETIARLGYHHPFHPPATHLSVGDERIVGRLIVVFGLCVVTITALGFFGGELVYGARAGTVGSGDTPLIGQGADLFMQKCAVCHFADKRETKIGPGLKGLFQQDRLAVSQKPVSEDAIINQLISPGGSMPPFPDLNQEQIRALIAYLKTL